MRTMAAVRAHPEWGASSPGIRRSCRAWTPSPNLRPRPPCRFFLSHELFHRYNFQVAGFSDDLGERDLIWRSLWAEGLATYVSGRLNPSKSLSDALIFPQYLETQAKPFVRQMASELLTAADRVDPATFAEFFEVESPEAKRLGWPPRSGYYVGYLVAQDLGLRHRLSKLAHMQGPALRAEIGRSLEKLAGSASAAEIPSLPIAAQHLGVRRAN